MASTVSIASPGLACDLPKLQASARGNVDNAPRIAYFVVLQRDLSHHCVFRGMLVSVPMRCRSRFRNEADQDSGEYTDRRSGPMPISFRVHPGMVKFSDCIRKAWHNARLHVVAPFRKAPSRPTSRPPRPRESALPTWPTGMIRNSRARCYPPPQWRRQPQTGTPCQTSPLFVPNSSNTSI